MDAKKLARIRDDMAAARRKPQTQSDLAELATRLGRRRRTGRKGKHPTWITDLEGLFPLSIPDGKGRDLPPGTRNSVLNQLEDDVAAWEAILQENENGA
jgi:hypothetical protein